eukprot:XP_017948876.1 PREDICTED: intestinal mucin-like protein [Xenopus tropicalis]
MPGDEIARSGSRERNGKCYSHVCDETCKKTTQIETSCEQTTTPRIRTTHPTTTSCACYHEGRTYLEGDEIARSHSRERNGKCYSHVCDETCKKTTRIETSCEQTTTPQIRTTHPTTTSCACYHEGRTYLEGDEIARSHSRERDGKCYSHVCDETCKKTTRIETSCEQTTTPQTRTTPPTTTSCVCHHEGRIYMPGDEILRSGSRERNGKCYRHVCDETCKKTTRIETSCEQTTTPRIRTTHPTTTSCACYHEGRTYLEGDEIARSHSRERDGKCYSHVCDKTCKKTTRIETSCEQTTTPPKTTPPTTTKCVCYHEGRMYMPGEEIARSDSREKDGKCYSHVCDSSCMSTTRHEKQCTTIKPPTKSVTTSPPTRTHTTQCSCYHNGKVYIPGEEVTRSTILEKCYKFVCDGNCGELPATEISCKTTPTTTPTTTKPTTKSTVTTISTTTPCVPHTNWQIANCTKAVCSSEGQLQIVQKSCTSPPVITCANKMKPIAVPDGDSCCWHWECPCMCGGWEDHYLTFDGTYYTYQGNCTYVLAEEIVKTVDNFGIYLDNYDCGDTPGITCPRHLTVRHETQEIIISHKTISPISLETRVNGNLVLLPYTKQGVKVYKSGVYFVAEIPELQTIVTYDGLTFTIKISHGKFFNNIHGQCGTCTNNQADDCRMANGKIATNCEAMADSFMVHDPAKPHCKRIPRVHPTIPPTCKSSLCDLIMGPVFQKCHEIHSPEPFYQACLVDSCNKDNSHKQCTSLQHYASICGDRGVCIQWRSHAPACPFTCPSNKVYDACGPALPKTCQTAPMDAIELNNYKRVVEGCFCAKGSMPFSMAIDACVSDCGCVGPDNIPRKYGESFEFNCETCTCLEGGSGITCQKRECHHVRKEGCTREGFYQVTQISATNKCCEETVCRCDPSRCSRTFPKCGPGFELKGDIEEGHCCPTYACKPKHVCVSGNAEYLPGSHVYTEKCENCICAHDGNNFTIACHPFACNIHCPAGFKVKKNSPSDCCGTCVQTNCVVKYEGSYRLMNPGDELPSMNDNCTMYKCSLINDQFVTTVSQTSCPTLNEEDCEPGSIHRSLNGCCRTCIFKNDSCKIQAFDDYLTYQGCTSVTRVKMSRCEGSCRTSSMYSAHAQTMSHTCSCCQEVQTTTIKVKLRCPDGTSLDHKYIDVQECKCTGTKCPDGNI